MKYLSPYTQIVLIIQSEHMVLWLQLVLWLPSNIAVKVGPCYHHLLSEKEKEGDKGRKGRQSLRLREVILLVNVLVLAW